MLISRFYLSGNYRAGYFVKLNASQYAQGVTPVGLQIDFAERNIVSHTYK